MDYFICENSDECTKTECLMLIPRKVSKPVSNCDGFGCNVIDVIIDADRAAAILIEKYPELLIQKIPGNIGHT